MFPHLGQGDGGRPVAGKPHAGKYRELTLSRQRGGRGSPSPLLTNNQFLELRHTMRKHIFPTLFCLLCISLTACSGSAAVSYQPPNLPVKISIDTNGQLKVSWENSIQTPIGTFSAEISSDFSELYQDKNGVLIVNVNGVNSVYDLNGENNIVVTLESQ